MLLRIATVLLLFSSLTARGQLEYSANFTSGCTPLGVVITVTSPSSSNISSYAWTVTYPNGTIHTASSATYIAIFSLPGAYDVSLTINGNETVSIDDYIMVYGNPTANFSVNDQTGCYPLCIDFTDLSVGASGAQIVEWSWDFGNGSTSIDQNPTYCYGNVGTYSPVFSVEDEHGCFDDVTMPGLITVSSNFPTADFVLSSQLDCNPPVLINMTNQSYGFSDITSTWNFGDGGQTTQPGASDASHNYLNTGSFDVCLTVTDEIGCQDEVCMPVEIFDTAQADFSVDDIQVCENETVSFTNLTTPTPPQVKWDFDGNGTVDSTNPNPTFAYPVSGTYSPQLIVIYSSQCTDTLSGNVIIDVNDGIDVIFTADTLESCQTPFPVSFSNTSTGSGTLEYSWSIDGQAVSNASSFDYVFDDFGLYDISLEVTNEFGCSSTLTQNNYIEVLEPEISFNHDFSVCVGEIVSITNIVVDSVDPVVTWEWDFDGDGIADAFGPNPQYSYDAPGPNTVSVSIVTANGCTANYTSPLAITVQSEVQTAFTASTTYTCAGEQIEFCVEEQPGNTYSWNFGDDTGWQTYAYFDNCVLHDYSDTGYFDVTLSVFNGACSMTITMEDFIYIEPPVALYDFVFDCDNLLTVQFYDESILADSLEWNFGDGSPIVYNETEPVHTFPAPGTYTVTLTAYNDTIGCPDVKVDIVDLDPPDPSCTFSPTSGCPTLMVNIFNNSYNTDWDVTVSNGDHITVHWNSVLNKWQVTYVHDGITQNFLYSANIYFWPTLSFEDAGDYDITVTAVNPAGCSATVVYEDIIHVSANPNFATFSLDVVNSCDSVYIGFIADATNIEDYSWTFSDGTVLNSANPYHTFLPPFEVGEELWATLSAVDSTGCASTVTQNIDLILPANPEFLVASDPSCENDLVQFVNNSTGDVQSFWWDFGDPGSGADNNSTVENATHIFSQNGTYSVCLTVENSAGCQTTFCNDDAVHIINPEISLTYSASINNCLYGVSFTNTTPGNIIISEWDFGDNQTGLGINAYHTFPIGVYDVSLFVVNEYGCFNTYVIPDIFNYGDVIGPYTQVLDTANCTPFQADFSAFNPDDTYFDYFWDFDDGNGDPSGVTETTHIYTEAGTYCPSIIMTDPNGCPVLIECTEPIVVEAFELAFADYGSICFGDSLSFSVSGATNYVWEDPTYVTVIQEGQYLLHPPDTSSLIITGYYSDCQTTDTVHVAVNALPLVNISMIDEVCFQDPVFDLAGGTPNDVPGTYFIDGVEATQFDPSSPAGMFYEVQYAYTDVNNCTNYDTAQVYIHPLPIVTLNAFSEYCEDAPTFPMQGGSPSGGEYTISNNPVVDFTPSTGDGTYTVVYTYTDANGCINDDAEDLVIHPIPDVYLLYTDVCLENEFQVNNASTIPTGSIVSANWDFGSYGGCQTFEPIPVTYPAIGNYVFSVNLVSDMGCDSGIDTVVNVWAKPDALFSPGEGCQYTPLTSIDQTQIEEGFISEWIWTAEGEELSSPDSLSYSFMGWGQIPLQLIAVSDHGCPDTVVLDVTVHPAPVLDILTNDNCLNDLSVLISDMTIPEGAVIGQVWNLGDGWPELEDDDIEHYYAAPGTYITTLTAWSDFNCEASTEQAITIFAIPELSFTYTSGIFCNGQVLSFSDQSTIDAPYEIMAWEWWLDSNLVSTASSGQIVPQGLGQHDLHLIVTSDAGCPVDTMMQDFLDVLPKPDAGFLADPTVVHAWNPVVNVIDSSSVDVTSWNYDFGDGSSGDSPDDTHDYLNWGTYMITQLVVNDFGCMDTAYQVITVTPEILVYVPNSFTPDGDGINDVFIPVMSGFTPVDYEFSIFNRWGEKIFTTDDPATPWTGNVRDGELYTPDGVYIWQVNVRPVHDAAIRSFDGHVYILR